MPRVGRRVAVLEIDRVDNGLAADQLERRLDYRKLRRIDDVDIEVDDQAVALGEGIEKKEDNFVEEVMAQVQGTS